MIADQQRPMTLAEIKEMAETNIGKNVRYFACSADSMNTDEMISFLLNKRKLVKKGNGYVIDTGEVCDNDE